METLRNKRRLAAVTKETQEEHSRNGQSRNTSVLRINDNFITQVFEEIEGRVTKKLSQEFSRTESRVLGALPKLDEFLLNPQIRTHSGTVPGTFGNTKVENQGTNEDDFKSDHCPKAGIFRSQTTQNSGPEISHEMVTRFQKESLCGHNMVTGGQEEFWNRPKKVTATQEYGLFCSLGTSSGKHKKARCARQPKFRSENAPATIEADQIVLVPQQLAINNNIDKVSKLPKSLTTTIPTFNGKAEKIELYEDLFQTRLETQNQLTEEDKINNFHSLMRGDALQTFKDINSQNRANLTEIPTLFLRKNVKPRPMATAKHKLQQLVFNSANRKLSDFLGQLQKLAKNAFGVAAQAIIEQLI